MKRKVELKKKQLSVEDVKTQGGRTLTLTCEQSEE